VEDFLMANISTYGKLKQRIKELEKEVSKYKRVEATLREREEEYRNLFHSIPDPAVIIQNDQNVLLNQAFTKLFRYDQPSPGKDLGPFDSLRKDDADKDASKASKGLLAGRNMIPGFDDAYLTNSQSRTLPCEASGTLIQYQGNAANLVFFRSTGDRKQVEEELRKTEQRLSLALDVTQDGLWDWDLGEKRVYTSARFKELIGAKGDDSFIDIDDWASHIHPDHLERIVQMMQEHTDRRTPFNIEYLYRWHHIYGKTLFDEKGKAYRMAGYIRDITDQKRAEETLRESEKLYRLLAENVTDVIFTMDMDLNFTYLSPSITTLLGYSVDEALTHTCNDIFTPDSLEVAKKTYKEASEDLKIRAEGEDVKSYVLELELRHKDGSTVWTENHVKFLLDSDDQPAGAIGIIRNISDRKRIENDLRISEERLRMAHKATRDGIWDWNFRENELNFSPRIKELLGHEEGEEIADPLAHWTSRIHPDQRDHILNQIEEFRNRTEPFTLEFLYRFKDNEYRWVNSRSIVLRDKHGKPYRSIGSVRDIHREKQAEELIRKLTQSLINSQENERQKISRELHESVAQNLTATKSACEMLLEYKSVTPGVRRQVQEISESLQSTLMLVRNLSYDLRPPGLEKLGLIRTFDQYCKDFTRDNRIHVEFRSVGIDELKLNYDTKLNLYRIAQESLNNIRKQADAKHVRIKLISSLPHLILRIEDDGIGFDEKEDLSGLSSEKRIGLQNLQERVALLNGEMEVDSGPSKGTKILIKIPFATSSALIRSLRRVSHIPI